MNLKTSAAFVAVLLATFSCTQRGCHQEKYSALTDSLGRHIGSEMDQYNIKGTSIALIDDTTVVWQQGFGYTDSSRLHAVSENTLFSVQSVSKIVTATAFMMEVQKGTITLDDKLKKYWPQFSVNSRHGPDESDKITFRHLLSHRAGFGQEGRKGNNFSPETVPFDAHIKSTSESWLKIPVGKFYSYSNPGIDLVGYVLANNANKPFETYMKDRILTPLGMKSSTFTQSEAYGAGQNIARGFYGDDQLLVRMIPMLAAGGLYSNAVDLSRLAIFHLNGCTIGNTNVIAPTLQQEMYSIQYPEPGQQAGYALGLRVRPFRGGRYVHHRGGGYGYSSMVGWIPEYKIGIVILTNDGFGTPFINNIAEEAMSGMIKIKTGTIPEHQKMKFTDKPVQPLVASDLKKLVGTYKSARGWLELIDENGALFINGTEKIPLTAHNATEFTAPNGALFVFHFSAEDKPEYILNLNEANADFYMYNDAPGERPGPSKKEWDKLTGDYGGANNDARVTTHITLKNGYLYTTTEGDFTFTQGTAKLTEFKPGLFFSSDGESMEFFGDSLLVGNRPFVRIRK